MARTIPLFLLFLIAAAILVVAPRLPLRLLARLWYSLAAPSARDPRLPRWVSYYVWTVEGDRVPREVRSLEEMVRLLGFVMLAPAVLVLIIIVFD